MLHRGRWVVGWGGGKQRRRVRKFQHFQDRCFWLFSRSCTFRLLARLILAFSWIEGILGFEAAALLLHPKRSLLVNCLALNGIWVYARRKESQESIASEFLSDSLNVPRKWSWHTCFLNVILYTLLEQQPANIFNWNVSIKEQNTFIVRVWSIYFTYPIMPVSSLQLCVYTYTLYRQNCSS